MGLTSCPGGSQEKWPEEPLILWVLYSFSNFQEDETTFVHEVLITSQAIFPACVTLIITIIILRLFTNIIQFLTVHTVTCCGVPLYYIFMV